MTDDIIRSMKEQMIPSDDVVSDLLAKIAACEASPETMDNVDSLENFSGKSEKIASDISRKAASQAKKFTIKSIWFYGTAAAASVIVLLSAFSLFGGSDPDSLQANLGSLIDNPNVVIDPNDSSDDRQGTNEEPGNDSSDEEDKSENKGGFLSNLFGGGKDDEDQDNKGGTDADGTGDDKNNPSGTQVGNDGSDSSTPGGDSSNDGSSNGTGNSNTVTPPPETDSGNSQVVTPPVEVDDSKVTPGAPGEADISWDREILSDDSVAQITVSGNNYVVETVAASTSVASSEVKTISLEIPATSTTNHTTVKAKVKKVKNVSEELMVALDANGFKDTLLYTNQDYTPSTLGQFISDAGLLSNTSFNKAVYCKGEKIGYSSYQRFNIDGLSSLVSKYLFSNESAPLASYSAYKNGNVHVLFKSGSNPTCSVIDFGVSDNGYLYVKMASGNSFTFHIGEKNANGFINSVTGE